MSALGWSRQMQGGIKLYRVIYRLRNGVVASLEVIATSSWSAIDLLLDLFGEQLRSCSARLA